MINIDWKECPFCLRKLRKDERIWCPVDFFSFYKNQNFNIWIPQVDQFGGVIFFDINYPDILVIEGSKNKKRFNYDIPFFDPFQFTLVELREKIMNIIETYGAFL